MSIFAGPKIVEEGLVFYLDAANQKSYPGTGTTWNDLSILTNNSTLTNGITFSSNNKNVFDFDGTNDVVILPNTTYWNTNVFGTATNFTISVWAKFDAYFNWTCLFHKSGGAWFSSGEGASLWVDSGGFIAVYSSGEDGNPSGGAASIYYATSNTTTWFNIVFTGDSTTGRLYVNGNLHSSTALSTRTRPVVTSSNTVKIGTRGLGSGYFNGLLNLPMLYTRGLTAQEVRQNFEATRGRYGI
jgi:hypothetical protein